MLQNDLGFEIYVSQQDNSVHEYKVVAPHAKFPDNGNISVLSRESQPVGAAVITAS
jgi:transcription elongation GreA/GreB family factor